MGRMSEQLELILEADTTGTADPIALRCRLCAREARWLTARDQWGMYCNGYNCNNRDRVCRCGKPFMLGIDGAGSKYCAECRASGYYMASGVGAPLGTHRYCAWCGKRNPAQTHVPRVRGDSVWPYICHDCISPIQHVIQRLKAHHVSHERARQLLDDSGCEICGTDILLKIRVVSTGALRAALVVDHDHLCCPADSNSCGRCVRGLICQPCNVAAGGVRDSPKTARALADYLEAWTGRS